TAPYGSWRSPISADLICAQGDRLAEPRFADGALYWIESRPAEGGRSVLVRREPDGVVRDLTPSPFSVRSRVHEYGGGAAAIADGVIYFVNNADQRVYHHIAGAAPLPLTPDDGCRYADLEYDRARHRLLAVAEDHRNPPQPPDNRLVAIDCDSGAVRALASGADFYSTPRISPNGDQIAWLSWNHPQMPWNGTDLWLAEMDADGLPASARRVAGGEDESVFQPAFSPAGVLHFVSDRTGWWNLYRLNGDSDTALAPESAEFGRPQWQFNMRTYGFADADTVVTGYTQDGVWHVAEIEADGRFRVLRLPYTTIEHLDAADGRAVLLAASPQSAPSVVLLDCNTGIATPARSAAGGNTLDAYISVAQPLTFETSDGATSHALYYPPHNPDYAAPRDARPPLLVKCHGGPTAAADSSLDLKIQYWTSRGFAVLDVNYRGSSGYGRPYRRQLEGQWGIVDVTDCVDGARHLVATGRADPARLAIRGSSAGGYTVLAALTFHDLFTAGASYYGISDLETAMTDTHKFESRYGDRLLGPWPDARDTYHRRSPARHAARLNCPVIFFQGLKDRVVPPSQMERMAASLDARGVPVAALTFADEAHGFRAAAAIRATLEAELYFYGRVFGFEPADTLPGIEIRNAGKLSPARG
ncbi:MAG TPA: prolyl oligopeptidase family serine peptidase, partial [Gammaproteobacteria bacterium]|nr:prolyl oligopeptidase family serine peptidase [Gammaproteobacteria bacterium]